MESPNDEEVQPLLGPQRTRGDSVTSFIARGRSNTIKSFKAGINTVQKHRAGFLTLFVASIMLYMGFTLVFLPRTSLSRDFRRLNFTRMTKAETFRLYSQTLQRENLAKEHLRNYTSQEHLTGAKSALDYTVNQLENLGFSPKLEKYYPWLNTPVDAGMSLQISGKTTFESSMIEDALDEDPSSSHSQAVHAFHGYSANGDVKARFVYCGNGKLEDYEYLRQNGIELKDMIHIIRYDTMFRGLKVKNAEKNGAIAVVLYTDSYEDGNVTVAKGFKAYPYGPARNPSGFQRGSVEYFTEAPGDPTTPGYASKSPNTKRVSPVGRIPGIPSIPMSERDIGKVLPYLNQRGCSFGHKGNVKDFEYYSGPSDSEVLLRVFNKQNYDIQEITNVVVEIPGILGGSAVVIGNHRDSWTVGGAGDPNSGSSILLEIARGFSKLLKKGWKPLRTIKLISWDGEEPAMLGSTEYGEDKSKHLQKQVLAYFNLDTAISGSEFRCDSNPLLSSILKKAASLTPFTGKHDTSLLDIWNEKTAGKIDVLGSGTDFAVFQNHLGIPSANFKFASDGENDAVYQYHTNYDSHSWMERFVDPEYRLHNTLAIFTGLSTLLLSENEVVDFKSKEYVKLLADFYEQRHGDINETFSNDIFILDKANNLSDLIHQSIHIAGSFDLYTEALGKQALKDYPWWEFYKKVRIFFRLSSVNRKLKHLDRIFLAERGLKDRSWMKHSVFGPDKQLGYVGDVLPGLHEAIIDQNPQEVLEWLHILSEQIRTVNQLLCLD